jgi:hypothetical protein
MTISYTDQGAISGHSTFKTRLRAAVASAALAISGEAKGGSTDAEWAARQALAHRMLGGGQAVAAFSAPVLANIGPTASTATTQEEISDGELDTAVSSVWNDVAGIAATV